jgi:hypothetical protein
MPMFTKPSAAARAALMYITFGALILVWSGVWYFRLHNQYAEQGVRFFANSQDYVCIGLLLTGLTLLIIGLAVGRIGRAARHAELPPPEATPTVASTDQIAAQRGAVAAPAPTAPQAPVSPQPAAVQAVPAQPVMAQPVPPSRPAAPAR